MAMVQNDRTPLEAQVCSEDLCCDTFWIKHLLHVGQSHSMKDERDGMTRGPYFFETTNQWLTTDYPLVDTFPASPPIIDPSNGTLAMNVKIFCEMEKGDFR